MAGKGRDGRAAGPGLAVLDGSSLLHRAYYALPHLTSPQGVVTNAVYGFVMMLLRLLETERPERVVVAFDRPRPTFRHVAFDQYKATRKPMPDDLRPQGPLCEEVLAAFGIPVVALEGFEADDVLGTLACRATAAGLTTLIVTGDRDSFQLISPSVSVMLTKRGITETETYTPERVKEEYGIVPGQFIEVKGLMGDTSDNIPGVPGIGEKGALKLIQEYGTIEEALARAAEVGGRTGKLLEAYADQARLSRQLATIECDAPVELDPVSLRAPAPDQARLRDLFTALGFRNLVKKLPGGETVADLPGAGSPAQPAQPQATQGSLFGAPADAPATEASAGGPAPAQPPPARSHAPVRWTEVTTPEALAEVVRELGGVEEYGLAVVVESREPWRRSADGLALALPGRGWYVPLEGSPALDRAAAIAALLPLFSGDRPRRVGHDLKSVSLALGLAEEVARPAPGVLVDGPPAFTVRATDFDVMLASYVLDPNRGNHSLEEVAFNHLGVSLPERPKRGKGGPTPEETRALADHAVQQAAAALSLRPHLAEELDQAGQTSLFSEVEMALVPVLAAMERRGVAVDAARLESLSRELERRIETLAAEIYREAGEEFNLNSPRQLAAILFEKLHLPSGRKTKTGLSTSAEVLEELAFDHPIARHLLDHRQLTKLKTTYVDALPALVNPETGRLHTTFNQAVTATGRLSSTNPNLQNIPIRTEEGGKIREAFVAGGAKMRLVSADYSQIELRVMAHLSGDPILGEAFRSGEDIHTRTAAEMFGLAPRDVTPEMRSGAKAINFGIIYGISSFGLARGTKISRAEAQKFIQTYFARYAEVKRYLDRVVAEAREQGYVTTLLGRRRFLPDLHSRNYALRSFAERTAMNTPIQGTAADIIKLAMLACERELSAQGLATRMVLQVHDELVFEGPKDEVTRVAALVREAMEQALTLSVPLTVDVEEGVNWREGEKVPRA